MNKSIMLINGPNLNLIGNRDPSIYGKKTLIDIENACIKRANSLNYDIECVQSNHEGQLIDWIHTTKHAGIVINAGAYTHTSIAIPDALVSVELPVVEVHLSNIHNRESFRHISYISKISIGMICGFGAIGYELAIEALIHYIDNLHK
ncbi:MAG: type II 3-dehydroquinate dehydratase [Rhodospirillaceae bacterium]|jgi:3-dehydroquinate dehydratase-2|nr:type II 3-dehydroquinate dehydratase [Rhodospirillaceae bacterium]